MEAQRVFPTMLCVVCVEEKPRVPWADLTDGVSSDTCLDCLALTAGSEAP